MGKDRAEIATVNGTIAALEVRLVKWMIGADAHTLHRRQRNRNDLNVLSPGSCPDNGVHLKARPAGHISTETLPREGLKPQSER